MSKEIKTVKTYIKRLHELDRACVPVLKGYDQLTDEKKAILDFLNGEISNYLGEYEKEEQA